MREPTDPTAADWFAAARENATDAERLAAAHSWRNAYGLAGQALECALKGVILQRLRLNRWPSRQERRDLYRHNLSDLADLERFVVFLRRLPEATRKLRGDPAKRFDKTIQALAA